MLSLSLQLMLYNMECYALSLSRANIIWHGIFMLRLSVSLSTDSGPIPKYNQGGKLTQMYC